MQQADDPPSLPVGTEVSAKYKGAFCEAKVSKVVRNIKVKVAYKQGLGSGIVSDDAIKAPTGQLRVGAVVEVRHPDRKEIVEATITKIQDCSQYTVVFDDGDITTLRRTALCLKSGRHFNESETLDQLPLTHPEHFGNPVVGGRRGRRRGQLNEDSSDEEDESDAKEVVNEKEEHIGKVVCVETESKKKDKEKWFPALVVAPTAQATVRIRVKDEYLVRSFKDGRYYTVPKKEASEFTREVAGKQDVPAVQAALEFLDSSILPPHWDRDSLFGLSNLSSDDEGEIDSDSSDDEPHEEKDRFVAQLYKYMDDRGTPLNKVPSIQSRDVDLYRLFRAVQKRGGYNRVTTQNQWKVIALRLGFMPCTASVMNLVKQAYKKFLQPYGDFHRKLGCSMLMTSRNSNRSKGRSLVRANSVASPKPADTSRTETISKLAAANQAMASTSSSAATSTPAAAAAAPPPAAAAASAAASTSSSAAAAAATAAASVTVSAAAASLAQSAAAAKSAEAEAEESENTSESSVVEPPPAPVVVVVTPTAPTKKQRKGSAASSGKVKTLVEKYEEKATTTSSTAAATAAATPAPAPTTTTTATASPAVAAAAAAKAEAAAAKAEAAAAAAAAASAAAKEAAAAAASAAAKDAEADVPLAKIKAAAATATRLSVDKEPSGSNASSKAASETQRSRDVSPCPSISAAPSSTAKKEKHQRKPLDKSDEKQRGKRKKDEITVEKIDTGDFVVGIGDKLKVNYHEKKSPSSHGSTYEAKVIEISVQRGVPMYLVHYTGWNNRYDEWVPRERIAENLTKGSKQKTRTTSTSSAHSGGNIGGGGGGTGGSSGGAGHQQTPNAGAAAVGTAAGGGTTNPGLDKLSKEAAKPGAASNQPSGGNGGGPPPSSSAHALAALQGVTKTPTTGAKRGRGRSDSMPPRSTTPSSVASNSSRTKSPAASAGSQLKKRPTRTALSSTLRRTSANASDNSLASDSDTDSDEPVRRPKRQNQSKEQQTPYKAGSSKSQPSSGKSRLPPTAASDSDEEDEEQQEPPPSGVTPAAGLARKRSGGRALSSGAASAKGRDYDLSEIRSELKGFQPQILGQQPHLSAAGEEKAEATSETGQTDGKKESKMLSKIKCESGKSSSTELSSETDSFNDEDSQSSDKARQHVEYSKKKTRPAAVEKVTSTTTSKEPTAKSSASLVEQKEPSLKEESAIKSEPTREETTRSVILANTGEDRKPPASLKSELKEEEQPKPKPFHSGADIKPATVLAPARFNATAGGAAATVSKYASVIVEKPLGVAKAKTAEPALTKKLELLKKQTPQASAAVAAGGSGSGAGQEPKELVKKFVEPVLHKETATLKVEMPAACSPSSSSSSSSSFCSSASSAVTTVSASSGSSVVSSATRSLPDMSKLDINGGAPATAAAAATVATPLKEPKYSHIAGGSAMPGGKQLSSDIYEFKDTEPFEFEKRISPMAGGVVALPAVPTVVATSVITATTMAASCSSVSTTSPPTATLSAAARKQALKASAMQQSIEQHQLPGYHPNILAATTTTPTSIPGKAKKRGSPMKEATLTLEKPKLFKLEEKPSTALSPTAPATTTTTMTTTPPSSKPTAAALVAQQKLTPPAAVNAVHPSHLSTPTVMGTPFDVLRKSPSFNLNITALNEELAQTVQETTRALTDALQPPTPPTPTKCEPCLVDMPPKTPPPPMAQIQPALIPPAGSQATPSPASKLSTPPQQLLAKAQLIVGSPFIETRNVFELSTSNEGSGYSSGESKDNKLEKLENVKILLAGAAGPFDMDAVKYEQKKPSSIADKVLKAISQKKEQKQEEQVEHSKVKSEEEVKPEAVKSETIVKTETEQPNLVASGASAAAALKMLNEPPLKIQTCSASSSSSVLGELFRSAAGQAQGSPETKSLLESSLPAKNSELSETIQKLECAIQRKTPVGGLSLASSTAGTPPASAHTPNSTATGGADDDAGYSDESMDSTDSEQRLVIEDVLIAEDQTNQTGEQRSPVSASESASQSASQLGAPVKLEGSGKQQLPGLQAPIPLKLGVAANRIQSVLSATPSFAGKLSLVTAEQAPILPALMPALIKMPVEEPPKISASSVLSLGLPSSVGVPIVLPEIPVSVVMAPRAMPTLIPATLLHSPSSSSQSMSTTLPAGGDQPQLQSPASSVSSSSSSKFQLSPKMPELKVGVPNALELEQQLLLKPYTGHAHFAQLTPTVSGGDSGGGSNAETPILESSHIVLCADPLDSHKVSAPSPVAASSSSSSSSIVLPRPYANAAAAVVAPAVASAALSVPVAAASPLPSEPQHNESINLLCEETIPGSPVPAATPSQSQNSQPTPASNTSALAMVGLTPLPPDTPPPPLQQSETQSQDQAETQPTATTTAIVVDGPMSSANSHSAPNSSPNDSASQDDSSNEDANATASASAKKHSEHELSGLGKRKRTRKQAELSQAQAAVQDAQSLGQGKRRRQVTASLRQKATTAAGSDTDDNSDNVISVPRQSARQPVLQQTQQQQPPQQQQLQQHHQQQHQQQSLGNATGVRPCPYNFLVELDPSLTSDQCISILRKQIQDLRKAYNTIKSDLAVIDRRRKKLRRREREKKQQQLQNQQQGKIGA